MGGPGLVVWAGGGVRVAQARAAEGSQVVVWPDADPQPLRDAGVPFRPLVELLGGEALAAADAAGRSWARVWPRLPLAEGRSFRELVEWRGQSLLWAAEHFLRSATAGPRCARTAELCLRLLETLRPSEVDVTGLPAAEALLLARASTACGVLFHGEGRSGRPRPAAPRVGKRGALRRVFEGLRLRRRPPLGPRPAGSVLLLILEPEDRPALAPLVEALSAEPAPAVVAVEPRALVRFESRRVRRAAAEAERMLRERLRMLRGTPAVAASYAQRGVGFADLASSDLDALLLVRLPAAVRCLEAAIELIAAVQPALLALALADRDLRRTLGMASAAASVPWVALVTAAQEADQPERADAGPHPEQTLLLSPGADAAPVAAQLRASVRDARDRA